jgi:chromosome segregation ATPase
MQTAMKITPQVRQEIVSIIDERIREVHVTKEDFSELKAIVRDIAEAHKRTENLMEELAEAQKELTGAQKRTESKLGELAEAQKGTEAKVGQLAEAQKNTEVSVDTLAKGLEATRTELGGLARSVAYSLENEAYRQLPGYLKEHFQIVLTERMIRLELEGEEVNLFARGKKNGKDLLVVGEAELRLSSIGKLRQLEKKVALVKKAYPGDFIPLLITHFARPQVLEAARERGIIVVQSFEW